MNTSDSTIYGSQSELLSSGATQSTFPIYNPENSYEIFVSGYSLSRFTNGEYQNATSIVVWAGGSISDAELDECSVTVKENGTAYYLDLGASMVVVSSGGKVYHTKLYEAQAGITVSSGGFADGVVINTWAGEDRETWLPPDSNGASVERGGTLLNTKIVRHGGQSVNGYALNNYIGESSTQGIGDYGSAVNNILTSSAICTMTGGTALNTNMTSDSKQYVNGGIARNTDITNASQIVSGEVASARETRVHSGGLQDVNYGYSYDTVIFAGGWQRVRNGAIYGGISWDEITGPGLSFDTIIKGGLQSIEGNGTAFDTVILAGQQLIMSGGVARNSILKGGNITVQGGGALIGITIQCNNGTVNVASGGVISGDIDINGGGIQIDDNASYLDATIKINLNGASDNFLINVPSLAMLNLLNYTITDNGHTAAGIYKITNIALNTLPVTLSGVQKTLTTATPYVVTNSNETVTYTLSSSTATGTVLNIYGTYKALRGWSEGNNWRLATSNSKVTGGIFGTANNITAAGNVALDINLNTENNTGNIYGIGANASANGNIEMSLHGGGKYYGMIFGGAYTQYNNCTVGGNINLNVSGISQLQNSAVTTGNTRWLMGGFYSLGGFAGVVNGSVNMQITDGANLGHVMGGGYAVNSNSVIRVKGDVNMTLRNVTIGGHVVAGGYTAEGGTSIIEGNTNILIDATESITFSGNIIAGGYRQGANTVNQVLGTRTVTLTGLGSNINIPYGGINGGDNTPGGTRMVVFDDFTGSFAGGLYNLDSIKFAGDTVLSGLGNTFSSSNFVFDITDRSSSKYGTSMMDNMNVLNFKQNAGTVDIYLDEADFNSATSVALMDFDSSLNLNLNFNLYDVFGNAVAFKTSDETHGFNITQTNGVIALTYV